MFDTIQYIIGKRLLNFNINSGGWGWGNGRSIALTSIYSKVLTKLFVIIDKTAHENWAIFSSIFLIQV